MTTNPFRHIAGPREPAAAMEAVVDPAGWYPNDITATET